jgi:hypothetical protein
MSETDEQRMQRRLELLNHVDRARRLSPAEAETVIRFARDEESYIIDTAEKGLVEDILEHSLGRVTRVDVQDESEQFEDYHDVLDVPELDDSEFVCGVQARLPLGTLTVKGSSRSKNHHSSIINTPDDVESAREAFGGDDD